MMQNEEKVELKNFHTAEKCEEINVSPIFSWRSILAQFIAVLSVSITTLSIGMMIAIPTLALGDLRKPSEGLSLNEDEASWFGSLTYLLQPICSVMGGLIQPRIGCKYSLILTFIPQLIAWLLLPVAQSVNTLYLSAILFGVSAGTMEAPGLSYIGEVSDPRIRSMLTCSMSLMWSVGYLIENFIGTFYSWRTTAAISVVIPLFAIASILCIPESPIWLLSKGKEKDAFKALCWLRGWETPESVKPEFEEMIHYVESSLNSHCDDAEAENSVNLLDKLKNNMRMLSRSDMRKPLLLIIVGHFSSHSASLTAIRSYMFDILRTVEAPVEPTILVSVISALMICGGVICILSVRYMGKRRLLLSSLVVCSSLCVIWGVYTYNKIRVLLNFVWLPVLAICGISLIMNVGMCPTPWMLTSELFPVKGRSLGAGLAAAAYYIIGFLFSKTFYSLQNLIGLPGCFLLYGFSGFVGFWYMYTNLPETEGKSLAEVEEFFSKTSTKSKEENSC